MGWQWVNIAYLVGGVILLYKRIISWQIPVAMFNAAWCLFADQFRGSIPTRYSPFYFVIYRWPLS